MIISLEQARREIGVRQRFAEERNLGEFAPYVSDIIYSSASPRTTKGTILMPAESSKRAGSFYYIPGGKSKLWVYASTFNHDNIQTESDFDSVFVDHECFHAKQNFRAVPNPISAAFDYTKENSFLELIMHNLIQGDKVDILNRKTEIEAYQHQLAKIESGERDVSRGLEEEIRLDLDYYINLPKEANLRFLELIDGVIR
ncbi:hypothetical protein K8R33_03435 [archaeon]|nr:hypothetical protein [archaeon]